MRAVLTRAGIVCILIAGCGNSGAELGTGTGGEIGDGMGGSSGNVNPNGSAGGTVAGAGGTPVAAGGTAGVATTSTGGNAGGGSAGSGAGGTAIATGGTTATGGSAGAMAATPATAALVPLYTVPSDSSWAALAAAKTAHINVPVYAIIDPANGPGAAPDAGYAAGIGKLQLAGVTVIGYVPTSYGARSVAAIQADIDRWKQFYPGIQGIFFDEMSIRLGDELIYKTVSQYAKSKGMTFTVGNPGVDTKPTFVGTTDVIVIYEGAGFPQTTALSGWHTSYPKSSFAFFVLRRPRAEPRAGQGSAQVRGYVYVNTDVLPNPWDSVPSYLGELFADLE